MSPIKVTVTNPQGPRVLFARIERETIPAATEAAADYLIGNEQRGLKHLAPYKYVSRKSAYGQTFFSDKQRRWFWAQVKDGNIAFPIHYQRTGEIAAGWQKSGGGNKFQVVNRVPGVDRVMGDTLQARQPAKVGHRKVSEVIANNFNGMLRAAQQAVARVLKGSR